ncbi:MAG: hypothetical protein JSW65_00860 [Candidatus Bipolaricaulota bacterium]|nr:MAG: hypothetical protein JSW65_00860 [Candidatus Bipolaricaulota bacterium]
MSVRKRRRPRAMLGMLLACFAATIAVLLTSCTLLVGNLSGLVPDAATVRLLAPPEILSGSATAHRTSYEHEYRRECGWFYWIEPWVQTPSTGWVYGCRDVWYATVCRHDIVFRFTVEDPSDDLGAGGSARLRVHDSEPASGNAEWGKCFLDVPRTDLLVEPADVMGGGTTKTVTVRLRDVLVRFTSSCRSFSARLRCAIVLDGDNGEVSSANTFEVLVEFLRP